MRKSTSDRKSKEGHRSRRHRDRRSYGNTNAFIEPLYIVDPWVNHPNVPLILQPLHDPSQSTWNPVYPVEYTNPPTSPVSPNVNQPTQLSIGPLYLIAEGRTCTRNPVILEGVQSKSIHQNRPIQKHNLHERQTKTIKNEKPGFENVVGVSYYLPAQTEAFEDIHTWKSQNRAKSTLIDTPTQYEYEIPSTNRWPLGNNEAISDTSYLTSLLNNDSWNHLSEKSGDSVLPGHPGHMTAGGLTIMRVADRQHINQGERLYDLNSPHTSRNSRSLTKTCDSIEASKLNQNLRWNHRTPGMNREKSRKICMNDLDKERSAFSNLRNGVRCDPRQMNIKTVYSKRSNSTAYRCANKSYGKTKTFRGMTTEDSINDLYRKINDIQSSLEGSPVNGLLARKGDRKAYPVTFDQCFCPRQLNYNDSEMPVTRNNTITRGISPINFRTIGNTGLCCSCDIPCCYHCEGSIMQRGLSSPNPTCCIDSFRQFSNNLTQCPSYYSCESGFPDDGIHHVEMHYPDTNALFQADIGSGMETFSPKNENFRIVIDQEAECQSPPLPQNKKDASTSPTEEICDRPCNCPENTVPNSNRQTAICCDPNELIPNGFPGVRLCTLNTPHLPDSLTTNEKRYFASKDNSTLCSSSDLPPSYEEPIESRSESVNNLKISNVTTGSQSETVQPFLSLHKAQPCQCDFNKDLNNIMNKIEDDIISKLEKKILFVKDRPLKPSSSPIQDNQKTELMNSVPRGGSERADFPTKLERQRDASFSRPAVVIRSNNQGSSYVNREQELVDSTPTVIINNQPILQEVRDSKHIAEDVHTEEPSIYTQRTRRPFSFRKRRKPGVSSFTLRRRTRRELYSSRGSVPRSSYTNSSLLQDSRSRTIFRHGSPVVRRIPGPVYRGPPSTHVLTTIPCIERVSESSKDEPGVPKDDMQSDMDLEGNKVSFHDSTVEKNETDRKESNSYQIRRIKLSGPKKHIYVLVKKRNKGKNTSSQESRETLNISTLKPNYLTRNSEEKIYVPKDVKPKKIRKVFMKSSKET